MQFKKIVTVSLAITLVNSMVPPGYSFQTPNAPTSISPVVDHEHGHDEHGPNGGELFEVGKHEYHLELCLNEEKKTVTLHLLDSKLEKSVAINQPHLLCNFKVRNKPIQAKLTATPLKGEAPGTSSIFATADELVFNALHDPKSDARIAVRFGTKQYNVKVSHNHDHAGHAHANHSHGDPKNMPARLSK